MFNIIRQLLGSSATQKRMILCLNSRCREAYDLDHIVPIFIELVPGVVGAPVLVDHSRGNTNEGALKKFLDHAPYVGCWICNRCRISTSWNDSYRSTAILRESKLIYYTGDDYAAWGTAYSKLFNDLSEYDPQLPASSLEYLLDGTLYGIPRLITYDTCREILLKHVSEATTALERAQGRATEAEAALLTIIKLQLSVAVRNSETWDSAESRIARIIRS